MVGMKTINKAIFGFVALFGAMTTADAASQAIDVLSLKDRQLFSFKYGGVHAAQLSPTVVRSRDGNCYKVEYTYADGLKVTTEFRYFPKFNAAEWFSWFENVADHPTPIISDLWDCDLVLPFLHQNAFKHCPILPNPDDVTKVHHAQGSLWIPEEFCDIVHRLHTNKPLDVTASGGRSSQAAAPFFNVEYKGQGISLGIGWSGQWKAHFARNEKELTVRTGIEKVNFKLLPGEKIRTSSVTIMAYDGNFIAGQNKWRRLLKKHFSLIGQPGRDQMGPLCLSLWGGMNTKSALQRISHMKSHGLHEVIDYVWMDAGWYGEFTEESPNEYEGNWGAYTGDWRVNKHHHPDGLMDVAKAIRDMGNKYLLWFEPERIAARAPLVTEHPEYLLTGNNWSKLLNLGDEKVWQYCYDTMVEIIERLQVKCWRIDFNFDPLTCWRAGEAKDRVGINEIKYVMGLWRLWDAVLARFPDLIIDNCASGGRRLDMETIRRSISLWRSDIMCPANCDPDETQTQNLGFPLWLTYSGTGTGRPTGDIYRHRSAYSTSLVMQTYFAATDPLPSDEACAWMKSIFEEYRRVRPYFSCDFYPLTKATASKDVWCAWEYFRPEDNTGIIQVFRRAQSDYIEASFKLGGLNKDLTYTITDADTGAAIEASGKVLSEEGWTVAIREKRTAKLFFIKPKM